MLKHFQKDRTGLVRKGRTVTITMDSVAEAVDLASRLSAISSPRVQAVRYADRRREELETENLRAARARNGQS